jgi:hypothetical protein
MADPRDPLAAFDDEAIDAVAASADVDEERLRTLARDHQEGVRDLPGVDDIVYEWRNQFHLDPLLHRESDVYVLALRGHVWDEFGERLGLEDTELDALRALHDRQARRLVEDAGRLADDEAVVLTRP